MGNAWIYCYGCDELSGVYQHDLSHYPGVVSMAGERLDRL